MQLAVDKLSKLIDSEDPNVASRVALGILKTAADLRSKVEIEQRVAALEAAAAERMT